MAAQGKSVMGWGKWEPRWGQEEVCKEGGRDTMREWARRKPEDHPRGGWRREQGAKVLPKRQRWPWPWGKAAAGLLSGGVSKWRARESLRNIWCSGSCLE